MSRRICNICDNDTFENISGFYYCTVCSTKSQVIELHSNYKNA